MNMEKMEVILDFNEELATKIKNGEVVGSFITDDGNNAEFVYISKGKDDDYQFLFVEEGRHDRAMWASKKGSMAGTGGYVKIKCDVKQAFKDGDVLVAGDGSLFLYNGVINEESGTMGCHCGISMDESLHININDAEMQSGWANTCEDDKYVRFATELEKSFLIEKLRFTDSSKAVDLLKTYFKDEVFNDVKNLKPFDKVLVRNFDQDEWNISLFNRAGKDGKDPLYICLNGFEWNQCIPYEGNEYLLNR